MEEIKYYLISRGPPIYKNGKKDGDYFSVANCRTKITWVLEVYL
jgi:hypothetical protein